MGLWHCGLLLTEQGLCARKLLPVPLPPPTNGAVVAAPCSGGWGVALGVLQGDAGVATWGGFTEEGSLQAAVSQQHAAGVDDTAGSHVAPVSPPDVKDAPSSGVTRAAAGWDHCVVLCADRRAWAAGWNTHGQATGDEGLRSVARLRPVAGLSSVTITEVAAGECHSLALSAGGDVWAWGGAMDGQVGHGCAAASMRPVLVTGPGMRACGGGGDGGGRDAQGEQGHHSPNHEAVVQVAAGARHSVAVTASGALLCWGSNKHGQCGQEAGLTVTSPTPVRSFGGLCVAQASAGLGHSAACTESGDVYCWGWNCDGQLGLPSEGNGHMVWQPALVEGEGLEDAHVCEVACGARHTTARTTDGTVFAWGGNAHGQLGQGDTSARHAPTAMQVGAPVRRLACGHWHTLLLAA
eukprot:jgi/Tetstr1/455920/TSEL_042701.t1